MAELIVIRPDHPFGGKELFFFALSLGLAAWFAPVALDFGLANVPSLAYRGSAIETAVGTFARPVLIGLGAAILGFCSPRLGWIMAPAVALVDVFLWVVQAGLAAGQSDVERLQVLGPALLRILSITMVPAAVVGVFLYLVRD